MPQTSLATLFFFSLCYIPFSLTYSLTNPNGCLRLWRVRETIGTPFLWWWSSHIPTWSKKTRFWINRTSPWSCPMHCGFSRWKLLLWCIRVIRIKPLCLPNKDHNQNLWHNTTSQIHSPIDPLRTPLRPHSLLLSLHKRKFHIPQSTTLPLHKFQGRSHLLARHYPFKPLLQKSLHHALQIFLSLLACFHCHISLSLSHALWSSSSSQ